MYPQSPWKRILLLYTGLHRRHFEKAIQVLIVMYGNSEWSYMCVYLLALITHTSYFGFKQACISKKIPYHGVRPFEACRRIQNYQKPEAPSKMTPFEDKLWEICEKCWSKPDRRPTMSDIIESLVSINDEV